MIAVYAMLDTPSGTMIETMLCEGDRANALELIERLVEERYADGTGIVELRLTTISRDREEERCTQDEKEIPF